MVESVTVKLARHLHDRHHPTQAWDSCVQGCRDFYSLMADSAILYLKEHDHMKLTLADELRERRLDAKAEAQMEGGE